MVAKSKRAEGKARRSSPGKGKGRSSGKSARTRSAAKGVYEESIGSSSAQQLKHGDAELPLGRIAGELASRYEEALERARRAWSSAFPVPPQVMGWSQTVPAEQRGEIEKAFSRLWSDGTGHGWSRYAAIMFRTNAEVAALAGRRFRAFLEQPARLSHCSSPQHVLEKHAEFIEAMLKDYQTTSERLMELWMGVSRPDH